MLRHGRLQLVQLHHVVVDELLVRVDIDRLVLRLRAVALNALVHVIESLLVRRKNAVLAARLDRHVGDRHAVVHVHRHARRAPHTAAR